MTRLLLFEKPADYAASLRVLDEAPALFPMRVLTCVLMPNHWHFVPWPQGDGHPGKFLAPWPWRWRRVGRRT